MLLQLREELSDVQNKVTLYLSVNRFDAAEKLLLATLAEYGPLANIHFNLGLTYHKQSKFPDAIKEFRRALDLNPRYVEAALCLAATLCDVSAYEEAQSVFALARGAIHPKRQLPDLVLGRLANYHAANGSYYAKAGQQQDAIGEYRKSLLLFPQLPDIKFELAKLYVQNGDLPLAQKELEETLQYQADFIEALQLLGLVYFRLSAFEKARDVWLRTQSLHEGDPVSRAYLRILGAVVKTTQKLGSTSPA